MKKITIIGGGSGTYVVTQGLKDLDFDLTKIVTVFDSGGSTARLRDEFGFLPIGDLRQSLAALAKENGNPWIRELLLYRFSKGKGLEGHNLGNLILTALQDMTGSTPQALEVATKIFRLKGTVLPVALTFSDLKITYSDGKTKIGEDSLDDTENIGRIITKLTTIKPCRIYTKAKQAILNADYIIIGPGDIYGSLVPNFIVKGAQAALRRTKAKKLYIVNLMTRATQTPDFTAADHVSTIEQYMGTQLDYVFVNTGRINTQIAKAYAKQHEYPVVNDLNGQHYKVIAGDFASSVQVKKKKGDKLTRALMRHDKTKLTRALKKIIK